MAFKLRSPFKTLNAVKYLNSLDKFRVSHRLNENLLRITGIHLADLLKYSILKFSINHSDLFRLA